MQSRKVDNIKNEVEFSPMLSGADYPKAMVDEYMSIVNPPLYADVDMDSFIRLLLASVSLDAVEKHRVLQKMESLCEFQIDSLIEVFNDEISKFGSLVEHWEDLAQLMALTWERNCMLANYLGVGFDKIEERELLTAMIKQKYDTEEKQEWLERLPDRVLVNWVFSLEDRKV